MTLTRFTELDAVVNSVESLVLDATRFEQHLLTGTDETYYDEVLGQLAIDFLLVPLERELTKLPAMDDSAVANDHVNQAVRMIARMFRKSFEQVSADLAVKAKAEIIDDLRTSRRKQHEGLLN